MPRDLVAELAVENTQGSCFKGLLKAAESSLVYQFAPPPWGEKQLICTENALFPLFFPLFPNKMSKVYEMCARQSLGKEEAMEP